MAEPIMNYEDALARASARHQLTFTLKRLLVDRLDLPYEPSWITDDQPLFGRGLELDSVDALEIAVGMEYDLEVSINDDNVGVFGSMNSVADYAETALVSNSSANSSELLARLASLGGGA